MKKLLSFLLTASLIAFVSCAANSTKETDSMSKDVEFNGFLQLTGEDLVKLEAATRRGAPASEPVLSDDRKASCQNRICNFLSAKGGVTGDITLDDLKELVYLHNDSISKAKAATVINGPVTLRCATNKCSADLYFHAKKPIAVKGQGKVVEEGDPKGTLLQSFVNEILRTGAGTRY